MSAENLWGDLPLEEKLETPLSILRSQASALTEMTNGALEGSVVRRPSFFEEFCYEFRITVPGLGNYSTTLFALEHGISLYPATFFVVASSSGWTGGISSKDPIELKVNLKVLLQSPRVRQTVAALHAQLGDAQDGVPPRMYTGSGQYS